MAPSLHVVDNEPEPQTERSTGGTGGGGTIGERLVRLEERVVGIKEQMATKADIAGVKIWALSGALGGMVLAATLAIAILKLFSPTPPP